MDGQSRVVRLHHSVGHLGRGNHRVGVHDSVRILLPDLGDEECSHTTASTSSKRVGQLEPLQTVTRLGFFSDYIENRVDQLGTFCVGSLCPVVSCPTLSKDKVVRSEDLSEGSRPDTVHGARLQVDKDSPWDVLPSSSLIVVHVDPLQLEVTGAIVAAGGVDTVLVADDLPELSSNLVSTLPSLKMDYFSHLVSRVFKAAN